MEQKIRDKPSTKARQKSYAVLRQLFNILDVLMISHPLYTNEADFFDYRGWKEWVIKYTPPNKRGGPNPKR